MVETAVLSSRMTHNGKAILKKLVPMYVACAGIVKLRAPWPGWMHFRQGTRCEASRTLLHVTSQAHMTGNHNESDQAGSRASNVACRKEGRKERGWFVYTTMTMLLLLTWVYVFSWARSCIGHDLFRLKQAV